MSNDTPNSNNTQQQPAKGNPPPGNPPNFLWSLILMGVLGALILSLVFPNKNSATKKIPWGEFVTLLQSDAVVRVRVEGYRLSGSFVKAVGKEPASPQEAVALFRERITETKAPAKITRTYSGFELVDFQTVISPMAFSDDGRINALLEDKLGKFYDVTQEPDFGNWYLLASLFLSCAIVVFFFMMLRRAREQMMGGGIGGVLPGFSRSPARKYDANSKPVTFNDVAGLENVKKELMEIVDYLKEPEKFIKMGARIPKGMLLMGPPGTGKTLLGRAVAGEAGVPFYVINGSEFIQLYAGVGASRVRDLFHTAKENSPAILFIDEIDAVGRHRGAGIGAGHDEREQTLNQILSEMDGFAQSESVMIMAATNRPDVLDPALLRPGRFDRHIVVERPTMKGRVAIFTVHIRGVPIDDDVDLKTLARGTVGFTGADIKNLVNEATLWATRNNKTRVSNSDFDFARDKVMMGLRREDALPEQERPRTACHESGHTIIAWMEPIQSRVHKVSIIPRGRALGSTQILPEEDQVSVSEKQLYAQLACLMAGRVAEKIVFNESSAGAEDDLKRATRLARKMVASWGMSERLGPMAFRMDETHPFLGREIGDAKEFSEKTGELIDDEVSRILRISEQKAFSILTEKRELLDKLSAALESEEELEENRITEILGPSPFEHIRKSKEEE